MKKLSPKVIKDAIIEEAKKLNRKKEIYSSVVALNEELKRLDEVGFVGSFGFQAPGDVSSQTKTGFAAPINISHIARLEAEMAPEATITEEDRLNEIKKLQEENETLRKEIAEIKKSTIQK
jgi:hypothetical protein